MTQQFPTTGSMEGDIRAGYITNGVYNPNPVVQPPQNPTVSPPQNPANLQGTMGSTNINSGQQSPNSSNQSMSLGVFGKAMNEMRAKLGQNQELVDQKKKILMQLYDRPLTPQEKATLTPSQQRAIDQGNMDLVQMEVRLINDNLQNRTNSLDQSVKYLTDLYSKELDDAETKRQNAINSVLDFAQVYGSNAKAALTSLYGQDYVDQLKNYGVDLDKFTGLSTLAEQKTVNAGGGGLGSGLNSAMLTKVQTIANQFDSEAAVKNYQVSAEAIDAVKSAGTSPTDDQSRIYAFAKVMDPNSVVRESEYKTVQDYSQSLLQRYGFTARRVFDNSGFLTNEAREFMLTTLKNRLASSKKAYDNIYSEYGRRIDKISGTTDGTQYLTDYSRAFVDADEYINQKLNEISPSKPSSTPTQPQTTAPTDSWVGSITKWLFGK